MAKLLLVDDDPVLLGLMAKLLLKSGHSVAEAESAAACLARATAEPFDLIVADVMMPDMDGYELAEQLRARPELRATAILLLTSSLQGPDYDKALAAGADGRDVKTVNVSRLNTKIEEVLARRPDQPGDPAPEEV